MERPSSRTSSLSAIYDKIPLQTGLSKTLRHLVTYKKIIPPNIRYFLVKEVNYPNQPPKE